METHSHFRLRTPCSPRPRHRTIPQRNRLRRPHWNSRQSHSRRHGPMGNRSRALRKSRRHRPHRKRPHRVRPPRRGFSHDRPGSPSRATHWLRRDHRSVHRPPPALRSPRPRHASRANPLGHPPIACSSTSIRRARQQTTQFRSCEPSGIPARGRATTGCLAPNRTTRPMQSTQLPVVRSPQLEQPPLFESQLVTARTACWRCGRPHFRSAPRE